MPKEIAWRCVGRLDSFPLYISSYGARSLTDHLPFHWATCETNSRMENEESSSLSEMCYVKGRIVGRRGTQMVKLTKWKCQSP